MIEFKSYKAITTNSSYNSNFDYNIVFSNNFGHIKLNEDYVSEVIENVTCSLNISSIFMDDFICFFFKNRIVLFEKFIPRNPEDDDRRLREIWQYWPTAQLGTDWKDCFEGVNYYTLPGLICNVVVMNNGSTYTIPILRR